MVFAHQELSRVVSARSRESMKKRRKIGPWSLRNLPRSVFDPAKIDPGAFQNAKKPAGMDRIDSIGYTSCQCGFDESPFVGTRSPEWISGGGGTGSDPRTSPRAGPPLRAFSYNLIQF